MTGYGSTQGVTPFGRLTVELKSVNNRFLEFNPRPGPWFAHLEAAIRGEVRSRISRGKVDLSVRFDPSEEAAPQARVNVSLLKRLVDQVGEAFPGRDVDPEALLGAPGVVASESDPHADEELGEIFTKALGDALDNLVADRRREGEALREAIRERHVRMKDLVAKVTEAREPIVQKYRERLWTRLEELMGPKASTLDPGRLEQEVSIFADKADISEECSRLAAHLDALAETIEKNGEPVGRALEFLVQEILRETNTIGSKCRDLDVIRYVLELKQENESLREIIANIE